MSTKKTVAFIGLGTMGGPMAANLAEAGIRTIGVDLNPEARDEARSKGIEIAETNAEAVADADCVITVLPAGKHVRSVFAGDDGIWANAREGALLIDASTVDIETSQWCHDESKARGFRFADAPVSGGVPGAVDGTLTVMLGADPDDVAELKDLFDSMTARAIDTGGPTKGIAAKICNNMMLFINLVSTCEGAQLAENLGLDAKVFQEIASTSSGRSFPLDTWYPAPGVLDSSPAERGFAPDFPAKGALKDVSLALAAGKLTGVNLPAAELTAGQFQTLIDEGLGGKDCSLIVKLASPNGEVRGFTPEEG